MCLCIYMYLSVSIFMYIYIVNTPTITHRYAHTDTQMYIHTHARTPLFHSSPLQHAHTKKNHAKNLKRRRHRQVFPQHTPEGH